MKYRILIDGLLSEFSGGEAVLLDLTRKRYHLLNQTAGFIWTALEKEPMTEEALAEALVAGYGIEPDRARGTASRFTTQLLDLGLIEASK
jgi:PqqD family protein of HPr-rel-A system